MIKPFGYLWTLKLMIIAGCWAGFYSCSTTIDPEIDFSRIAQKGENGLIDSMLIYSLDDRPTPQCHASTLETTSNGLIAAWFGGTHERHEDVGIWISRYGGESWSSPVEVADGIQIDGSRYPCWNPVLFKPKMGPLMLFYKVGPNPREWWGMMMTSIDEGNTWTSARKLGEGPLGHLIGPVKNKPVQLDDGSILCPSSTEADIQGATYWKVHFEWTNDLAETFEVIGPINDGEEFDAIQPSILQHGNGKLQILCRSRQNWIAQSWSTDNGQTWDTMTATDLPNPSAGTDAVTMKDGRHLLVYNHTTREGGFPRSRNMLNVALSKDGLTWKPVLTLEREEGEFSYPAVIQSSDGTVHITYTYQRKSIKYVSLDPDQLQ